MTRAMNRSRPRTRPLRRRHAAETKSTSSDLANQPSSDSELLFHECDDARDIDEDRRCVAPSLILHLAVLEPAVPDGYAVRNADQLEISKHHARTLAAIVEQRLDAGFREL